MSQITFIVYPTMIIRPNITINSFTDWVLHLTYVSDTPAINCLPSMHCIYCFITSYYIIKCTNINIKNKIIIVLYSMLIVLSTLFIKQHIIEDIILSFIYTSIAILIVHFNKNRITNLFNKIKI